MGKKVLFIEPKGVASNAFSWCNSLPLMGPVLLGTILKKGGHDVQIVSENMAEVKPADLDCDVLALSILTPTATRGYELAKMYRARNPKGRIIMGGIHASLLPDEALEYADTVVTGEAESIISDLINHGSSERVVAGPRLDNLDSLPIPDFTLIRGHKKMGIIPVMTSRGCPFQCEYCSVTKMFGREFRTMSLDNVERNLRDLKGKYVFFYDDNLTVQPARTIELCERIIRSKLNIRWIAQARADIARNEKLLETMYKAGCLRLFIGFESINPAVLKDYKKSQEVGEIQRSISVIHSKGIEIHGMFMFGSEHDDKPVFKQTEQFCRKMRIDSAQFMILTPFPGTKVFDRMLANGQLLHQNWKYYDGMHAVFAPALMKAGELQKGMLKAYAGFYSRTRLVRSAMAVTFRKLFSSMKSRFQRCRYPSYHNLIIRWRGGSILRLWTKLNGEYQKYLEKTAR